MIYLLLTDSETIKHGRILKTARWWKNELQEKEGGMDQFRGL
jgi:hypothetical protein